MGTFGSDLGQSRIVGRFLDEHLYPEIGQDLRRVEDLDDEHDGLDLRLTIPGVGDDLLIDEKAQGDYINDPKSSFVLELSYLKDGEPRAGWFYDASKRTEYYLFVWIPVALNDPLQGSDDIVILDCLLVDRSDIRRFLVSEGYTRDRIEQRAAEIRRSGDRGYHTAEHPDFFYHLTSHKDERPITLVMDYARLHDLAIETYRVSQYTFEPGVRLFDD